MDFTRAYEIAAAVRNGDLSAQRIAETALETISAANPKINAFTEITAQRARDDAARIDLARAQGKTLGRLAGVPVAVKNLFDIVDVTTTAGSKLKAAEAPALADAVVLQRLCAEGAIVVGALNMDPYAYGFTTENTDYGPARNPHDLDRISGGSSGGSGAAVAAGLVPISLGSDTNGSIRVPASLCGVFGLKPTFGRLPRTGSFPFVANLDHLGSFATNVHDLALSYDIMQGPDENDPHCAQRAANPVLPALTGDAPLRVARLTGYFDQYAGVEAMAATRAAAKALGASGELDLRGVEAARAAAFCITASEAGERHLATVKNAYERFEPHTRDRILAGAAMPALWYVKAQRLRTWFRDYMRSVFEQYDVLIAPATPVSATRIGEEWLELNGHRLPLRASMGLFTQPISFVGLPVVAAPIDIGSDMPIGVQLIAPAWREDLCLRAAARLEAMSVAKARVTKVA